MSKTTPEFRIFLPQMRMGLDVLVERARAAEAAGFGGIALMDHLAPPMAEDQPMHEAMITATWLAAHTETLGVGHLVLCDSLRHPAVLAKEAVSIDHASGGRFELGIGWGSVPDELDTYGVGDTAASARVRRLAESLEVMTALWSGETVDFEGEFHRVKGGQQRPAPTAKIPLLIGGAGAGPWSWWPGTRTGGTCRSTPSSAWRSCDRRRGAPGCRSNSWWPSCRTRPTVTE